MTGNWIKAVVFGSTIVLAGSLGGTRARAMGDEPATGETVTQYLTPATLEMMFPGAEKVGGRLGRGVWDGIPQRGERRDHRRRRQA